MSLKPQAVWNYFYELTQIPRPTFKIEEVGEYLYQTGKKMGLETLRDEVGNVLIRKPASPGMENKPTITLQAHMDMVPQKNNDVEHDFEKDPIDAYIDGEWVTARGTTLGADNGIGVAMALSILDEKDLKHGPLEVLITVNEEVGMDGAFGLKPGFLKGDILFNLDSEEDGNVYIGCAGGVDVNVFMDYQPETACSNPKKAYRIELSGLKGGHSGVDIRLDRGNANKLMARLLKKLVAEQNIRISEIVGGNMRNAIPREAYAIIACCEKKAENVEAIIKEYESLYQKEFEGIESGISLKAIPTDCPKSFMPREVANKLVFSLDACINGMISMLQTFPGVVEASTNMSIVAAKEGKIEVNFLARSSSDSRKMWVASQIESNFLNIGARVEFDANYCGWQPNPNSKAMHTLVDSYKAVYGKEPGVLVMHAGLECGIIQGVMPNMDMVSFGPEIRFPHSPDEKVEIKTVETTYNVLLHAIENI